MTKRLVQIVVALAALLLLAPSLPVVPFLRDEVGEQIGDILCDPSEGDKDPAVSPDGRSIAFIRYDRSGCLWDSPRSEIRVASEGRAPRRIATLDDSARLLSWSPDGSRLVFSFGTSPEGIYVVNVDGTGLKWLNPAGGSKWGPSWSPDGERIAFVHVTEGIQAMAVQGGDIRVLITDGDLPAWSPDGSNIAYVSQTAFDVSGDIAVFDLGTGAHRTIVSGASFPFSERPSWSRDGKTLAFAAAATTNDGDRWQRMEIYSIKIDGTGFRRLTNNRVLDRSPAWMPDGRIVFESERSGARQIYVMNADGTGARRLLPRPGRE